MYVYRGKYWAGIRAACEPVFHSDKLQTYVPVANKAMSSLVDKLTAVQSQGPVQINLALAGMTMDVIGGSAFGYTIFNTHCKTHCEVELTTLLVLQPADCIVDVIWLLPLLMCS